VTNTPDVLSDEVADTCLGLLLMTVRELPQAERWLREGHWVGKGNYPLTHGTLRGRTVGILALGRIGKAIAKRCEAFGLEIAYHGRRRQEDVPYRYYDSLVGMARDVDILISVAPGGPETYHVVDAEVLAALGPQGTFINIGRGSVVDEGALVQALKNRTIMAAGLDVFENEPHVPAELIALDNAVLLPHVGSGSHHTRRLMGQLVVDNIASWFAGKGPLTPVAETPWPRKG
jgi:lactate dehydrogenase-like 2-hydroxyacid dehydrogenase